MIWLILAACFLCPVMQMFDRWDHETKTGQDTESAAVVFALCAGAWIVMVRNVVRVDRPSSAGGTPKAPQRSLSASLEMLACAVTAAIIFRSPPLPLRI
jgi:hypothetical protein